VLFVVVLFWASSQLIWDWGLLIPMRSKERESLGWGDSEDKSGLGIFKTEEPKKGELKKRRIVEISFFIFV